MRISFSGNKATIGYLLSHAITTGCYVKAIYGIVSGDGKVTMSANQDTDGKYTLTLTNVDGTTSITLPYITLLSGSIAEINGDNTLHITHADGSTTIGKSSWKCDLLWSGNISCPIINQGNIKILDLGSVSKYSAINVEAQIKSNTTGTRLASKMIFNNYGNGFTDEFVCFYDSSHYCSIQLYLQQDGQLFYNYQSYQAWWFNIINITGIY